MWALGMIKKIAQAICRHEGEPWEAVKANETTEWHMSRALAALEAMLEPSEAMIAVGNEALLECKPVDYIFRVMINSAMEADNG